MSTSLSVIIRRFFLIFVVVGIGFAVMMLFSFDVIKIDWPSFMEIQPSFRPMEDPLPVPALSVPIQGAAYVPETGNPENPISSDPASVGRGRSRRSASDRPCTT